MRRMLSARAERLVITLIVFAGVFVLLYPTTANWFSLLGFVEQKGSYKTAVDELSEKQRQKLIDGAREYNKRLPLGPLRDPYMVSDEGDVVDLREDQKDYSAELDFGDGLIGFVEIPAITVSLPIYHGTDPDTLDKGAGHLHGSALPVGGASSHAVITAHSGRANASLFTNLDKVKKGDVVISEVAGERFYYRVDNIDIVDPVYTGDKLQQVKGKDYITLLTCTPTGVNSHRLLVRAERIPAPATEKAADEIAATDYVPDIPWFFLALLGVPLLTWFALALLDRRRTLPGVRRRGRRRASRRGGRTPPGANAPLPE